MSSTSFQIHQPAIEILRKDLERYLVELSNDSNSFSVISGFAWGATSQQMIFDIAITYKSNMIAVIEYVDGDNKNLHEVTQFMAPYAFIYTKVFLFACYSRKTDTYKICTKDSFNSLEAVKFEDVSSTRALAKMIYVFVESSKESDNKLDDKKNPEHQLDLQFYEKTEKVLDPEWCREQLGVFTEEICRYTGLESLFCILKNGTFRMNGLPGMNDKDEGLFAWNMIYGTKQAPNDVIKRRKGLINNAFIVSFSSKDKIDDLAQWRLYGNNAKGVCCVFSVREERIKDRFFLHPIKYTKVLREDDISSDDLLTRFKKYVETQSDLDYSDLSPVIFFYKNEDYVSEGEVRLLVDNKKTPAYSTNPYKREWLLTNANNIPNPYIDIPLKDFPLRLERILLGPNMNDIDTIQVQLETMLNELGIDAVVEPSNITSYRNPTE